MKSVLFVANQVLGKLLPARDFPRRVRSNARGGLVENQRVGRGQNIYRVGMSETEATSLKAPRRVKGQRGDVPGWVLITLMTAGLVIGVWTAAGPALAGVFDQAITRVTSF